MSFRYVSSIPPKHKQKIRLYYYSTSSSIVFVWFFGKIEVKINWPLIVSICFYNYLDLPWEMFFQVMFTGKKLWAWCKLSEGLNCFVTLINEIGNQKLAIIKFFYGRLSSILICVFIVSKSQLYFCLSAQTEIQTLNWF